MMPPKCELMNICMIVDENTNRVLVQNRCKDGQSWQGVAFPGGHVERGEGFGESVVREVYEETGLTVSGLKLLGIVHWEHEITGDRSIIACYKATGFSGELKVESDEGRNEWIPIGDLHEKNLAPWLDEQLRVFEEEEISEAFYSFTDEGPRPPRFFPGNGSFEDSEEKNAK